MIERSRQYICLFMSSCIQKNFIILFNNFLLNFFYFRFFADSMIKSLTLKNLDLCFQL